MTKTGNKKERELITRSANPKQSNENRNFKRVATSHNQFLGNNLFGPN